MRSEYLDLAHAAGGATFGLLDGARFVLGGANWH